MSIATLQADLSSIDLALSEFYRTGITRYTMPDGRSVEKDIKLLIDRRAEVQLQLTQQTIRTSSFAYWSPRRAQ